MSITPFEIQIPESELELLRRKLELTRLPRTTVKWREDNDVPDTLIGDTLKYWLESYDWRAAEALLNRLPQFILPIEVDDGFGTLDIYFVHSTCSVINSIPLLFIYGWPGSFMEIQKGLPLLNEAGFHVVAPSLPGYGFSSYTDKAGFDIRRHAEVLNKLMLRLGYKSYVVQGGDWGAHIARTIGLMYPDNVKAIAMPRPAFPNGEPDYTPYEQRSLDRHFHWFLETNAAYAAVQATKPLTLGVSMHDSPAGMFASMIDKLYLWSDSYPWKPTELITWTLLLYFQDPTTGFIMYHENHLPATMVEGSWAQEYLRVPFGCSAFPKEISMVPRSWAERIANVKFWRQHDSGGHFAMYEKQQELVSDMVKFYRSVWKG